MSLCFTKVKISTAICIFQPAIPTIKELCAACGCAGPSYCIRCKKTHYCSVAHQQLHWPHHKKKCSVENDTLSDFVSLPTIVFDEKEIVVEDAEEEKSETETKDEAECLKEFEILENANQVGTLSSLPAEELQKYMASDEDKAFGKFKKETNKEPEQIVRYGRNREALWIADTIKTGIQNIEIPKCAHCGSARQFEFQIMPQMLLMLHEDNLDWGVLAIYTCSKSCQLPIELGYVQEFIIKQDVNTE